MKNFKQLWDESLLANNAEAKPLRKYFASRALSTTDFPDSIRFHPKVPFFSGEDLLGNFPCILFSITNLFSTMIGLQRVYITEEGTKANVPEPKKIMGSKKGGAIRFDLPIEELMIAEGPETAYAIRSATGLPTWSAISADGMANLQVPDTVKIVHIWADKDRNSVGKKMAEILAERLVAAGLNVYLHFPPLDIPNNFKSVDWNDMLIRNGPSIIQTALKDHGSHYRLANQFEDEDQPYSIHNGAIFYTKHTSHGKKPVKLSNFSAQITEQIYRDNAVEKKLSFGINVIADNGKDLGDIEVRADEFHGMQWVLNNYGAMAIINSGQGIKDHLRTAIQILSKDPPKKTIFTHTGWQKLETGWNFIHAGGAINTMGNNPSVFVELEQRLKNFWLPTPSEDENTIRTAIKSSLDFLEIAAYQITVPLLSAVFRAPLCACIPADFGLFITGDTGVFKTELCSLAQAHFGKDFNSRNLAANWSSTENTLEAQSFIAKDAVLVIDDFAPSGTSADVDRLHSKAERLFRAQGNLAGRGRMTSYGSLRTEYFPRGLIISNGEDVPRGHSLRARMITLAVGKGDVNLNKLSQGQRLAQNGIYAYAMSSYLQWLASKMDLLQPLVLQKKEDFRTSIKLTGHLRVPDQIANLLLGFDSLLEFALQKSAISQQQKREYWEQALSSMNDVDELQSETQMSEDAALKFVDLVSSALVTGRAHLIDSKTGGKPENSELLGWTIDPSGYWRPNGVNIGWLEGDYVLLDPNASYGLAQKLAGEQKSNIHIGPKALAKRLKERHLLARIEPDHNTIRFSYRGTRCHALCFRLETIINRTGPIGPIGCGNMFSDHSASSSNGLEITEDQNHPKSDGANGADGPILRSTDTKNLYEHCEPGCCRARVHYPCGNTKYYGRNICATCHPSIDPSEILFQLCEFCESLY